MMAVQQAGKPARGMEINSYPQGEQHHHPCPVVLQKWGDFGWGGIMRGTTLPGVIPAGRSQKGAETHGKLLPRLSLSTLTPLIISQMFVQVCLGWGKWAGLLFHLLNNNFMRATEPGQWSRTAELPLALVVTKRICTNTNPSKTPTFSLVLSIKVVLPTVILSSRGNQNSGKKAIKN